MKKNKPVSTWPLSILVIVVSFLSILVVYQQVSAVWVEPTYQPNDTNLLNSFVFTPMAQDLDLGSHTINATGGAVSLDDDVDVSGDLNVDGSLTVGGVPVVGGAPSTNYWEAVGVDGDITNNNTRNVLINNQLCFGADCRNSWPAAASTYWLQTGNDIYYNAGKVGVGTASPNRNLHIYDIVQNAELDIQSVSGAGNHWAIYHDSTSNDLKFWKGGADRVTLADTGEIGINIAPSASNQITVSGGSRNGFYSVVSGNNIAALYGRNNHLEYSPGGGEQAIGVRAEAMSNFFIGGTGLYATGNIGVKTIGNRYGILASASGGNAIYATGYSGGPSTLMVESNGASYAAEFIGNVTINSGALTVSNGISFAGGARSIGVGSYFYINSGNGLPTLACDGAANINNRGAVYLDYSTSRFYVCNGAGGWKYTTLQ